MCVRGNGSSEPGLKLAFSGCTFHDFPWNFAPGTLGTIYLKLAEVFLAVREEMVSDSSHGNAASCIGGFVTPL